MTRPDCPMLRPRQGMTLAGTTFDWADVDSAGRTLHPENLQPGQKKPPAGAQTRRGRRAKRRPRTTVQP